MARSILSNNICIAFLLLIAAFSLFGCGGHNSKAWKEMDRAETLIPSLPDSAFSILDAMDTIRLSKAEFDHWKLLYLYNYAIHSSGLTVPQEYLHWGDSVFNQSFSTDEIKWHIIKAAHAKYNVDIVNRLENLKDAEFLAIQLDSKFDLSVAYQHLANLYGQAFNGAVAKYYADKSTSLFRALDCPRQLREARMEVVGALIADRDYSAALDSLEAMRPEVMADHDPGFKDYFLDQLARTYDSNGRSREAIAIWHSLYDGKDVSANTLAHWADAYLKINLPDSAYMLISKARDLPKYGDDEYLCWNIEYRVLNKLGRTSELARIDSLRNAAYDNVTKRRDVKGTSVALNQKYDTVTRQAWFEADQAKTRAYVAILAPVVILLIVAVIILYMRKRNQMLTLEHENDVLRISTLQNNLFESERRQKASTSKISDLFRTRFKLIDGLAASYFECKETGQEQKRIYSQVKNSIEDFSSPSALKELEEIVDGYNDNLMSRFREDFPKLSQAQYRLALYIFCGFSLPSISIFTGTDLRNIYVYKSRLKSVITKSDIPRKNLYLSHFP